MADQELEPRHRRHSRHKRRHTSSSNKSRSQLRWVDYFLIAWSLASLISFFYLLDKVESAPIWQVVGLAVSTVVGLVLFFRFSLRTKK